MYGNGKQTRSFQYVTDLVRGLVKLMESNVTIPVNLGNPEEHTIEEFATIIKQLTSEKLLKHVRSSLHLHTIVVADSSSEIVHRPAVEDDPQQRRPNITRAAQLLHWQPETKMIDGLKKTIEYFRTELIHGSLK